MLIIDMGSQPVLDIYSQLGEHLASFEITPLATDMIKAELTQVNSIEGEEPKLVAMINGDDEVDTVEHDVPFLLTGHISETALATVFDLTARIRIRSTGKLSVIFETPTSVLLFRRTPHLMSKLESVRVGAQAAQVI